MRKLAAIFVSGWLLLLLTGQVSAAADPLKDCPPTLVCLTRDEAVALRSQELDLRAEIVNLREKLAVAKAKRLPRFGHVVGCGGGYDLVDNEAALYCGYMFGYRF